MLPGGKIIAGDINAGKGVGAGPVCAQGLKGVSMGHVEHLVLQKMGHPRRCVLPLAVRPKPHVHSAVVGGEKRIAPVKFLLCGNIYRQPVFQPLMENRLSHSWVALYIHRCYRSFPFRK